MNLGVLGPILCKYQGMIVIFIFIQVRDWTPREWNVTAVKPGSLFVKQISFLKHKSQVKAVFSVG